MRKILQMQIAFVGVFISILFLFASLASAQVPPLGDTLCVGEVNSAAVGTDFVSGDPFYANKTLTGTLDQIPTTPPGEVGFSLSPDGPFAPTLPLPVNFDANGYASSIPFFVIGVTAGLTTVVWVWQEGERSLRLAIRFVTISPEVLAVGFEEIDSPLDTNPNAQGGLRIFPDKQSPTDTVNRKRVRVIATTSTLEPNVPIYFRSFDIDDPSSDSSPVDPNESDGYDNYGFPLNGTLSAPSAPTDSEGIAEVEFTVTMQPGDNFRVVASCNQAYLDGVGIAGVFLKDADQKLLPTTQAKVTDMLTVWRNLHIEVDSMGNVTGNVVTGTIERVRRDGATLVIDQILERNRFENGRISIDGVGAFLVTENGRTTVTIWGIVQNTDVAGKSFTLVDDDDFNNNDVPRDGDEITYGENEDVPFPFISLISSSDSPADNVFAPAYVRPKYDIGDTNDSTTFFLNTPGRGTTADLISTYDFDSVGTEADNNFWTVYLLGAYQYDTSEDSDPDSEEGPLGVVDDYQGVGASIFVEDIADADRFRPSGPNCTDAATAAHEVGHLFNGDHRDGGLMSAGCDVAPSFTDKTLIKIRYINHP